MSRIIRFRSALLTLSWMVAFAQPQRFDRSIHYRPGDWVGYPVVRFATCVAMDFRTVYFGTTNGITRYAFYDNVWEAPITVSDGLEDDRIHLLVYDFNSGILWAATESGLSFRNPASQEWQNLSYRDIGIRTATSLGCGKSAVWIESTRICYRGDRMGGPFFKAAKAEADLDEVQWRGALAPAGEPLPLFFMDDGYVFAPPRTIRDKDLRTFEVTDILRDHFDRMWMSVWGLGAAVADMKSYRIKLLPFGPYAADIHAMGWDDDGMWIGGVEPPGNESGITFWDMNSGRWRCFEAAYSSFLRNDDVTCIAVDTACVWFGTEDGLACYDKRKNGWRRFDVFANLWSPRVTSLSLGDAVLWVGTASGLNRIVLPSGTVERVQEPKLIQRTVHQVAADGRDAWIGTDWGIFHYRHDTKAWEQPTGWPGIVSHTVTAVHAFGDEIWFGTGDGVEVFNKKSGEWRGFPEFHFPIGGRFHSILADTGVVWFATDDGVLKYVRSENRWRRFTVEDGLLDNAVRWMLPDGDHIWFGTAGGLCRFYWNAPHRVD